MSIIYNIFLDWTNDAGTRLLKNATANSNNDDIPYLVKNGHITIYDIFLIFGFTFWFLERSYVCFVVRPRNRVNAALEERDSNDMNGFATDEVVEPELSSNEEYMKYFEASQVQMVSVISILNRIKLCDNFITLHLEIFILSLDVHRSSNQAI